MKWRPSEYEEFARRSPTALHIPLIGQGGGVFISKGWTQCSRNCGRLLTDWTVPMVERITIKNGYVTRGWYCR